MKTLVCSKCGRTQAQGKFCLDCGSPIVEKVTLGVEFKPIDTLRSSEAIKRDIRSWLARIGVQQTDIQIEGRDSEKAASVKYLLLGKTYRFSSYRQKNLTNNLAAVEQFLHGRVLGIERGIESVEDAFAGYAALPAPEDIKKSGYDALSKDELKSLLFLYHPDSGKEPSTEKFNQVKAAMDRKVRA